MRRVVYSAKIWGGIRPPLPPPLNSHLFVPHKQLQSKFRKGTYPPSSKLTCHFSYFSAQPRTFQNILCAQCIFQLVDQFLLTHKNVHQCRAVENETMRNSRSGLLEFLMDSVVICFFSTGILEEFLALRLAKADFLRIDMMHNRRSGLQEFLTDSVVICFFPTGILEEFLGLLEFLIDSVVICFFLQEFLKNSQVCWNS